MNIYDKESINCSVCGKMIGEVDIGSKLIFPLCKKCEKKEKKIERYGIKKILVPLDQTKKSSRALDAAIYFSKHLGASITLIRVIPIAFTTSPSFKRIMKEMTDESEKYIKEAKSYCEKKNISANHIIHKGDEPKVIIKVAKKGDFDLIIMGSSGKGILKEITFGSISNYVLNNTNIPVLTVKEKTVKLGTKIMKNKSRTKKTPKNSKKAKYKPKPSKKNIRHGEGIPFEKIKQIENV